MICFVGILNASKACIYQHLSTFRYYIFHAAYTHTYKHYISHSVLRKVVQVKHSKAFWLNLHKFCETVEISWLLRTNSHIHIRHTFTSLQFRALGFTTFTTQPFTTSHALSETPSLVFNSLLHFLTTCSITLNFLLHTLLQFRFLLH